MTEPREGISVAYWATQDSHGRQALDAVVSHATTHEGFVGGWLDPSDSLYYVDSVRLFPEDSLEAAVNFGKANFQKAIKFGARIWAEPQFTLNGSYWQSANYEKSSMSIYIDDFA